jgi:hypothetical protein
MHRSNLEQSRKNKATKRSMFLSRVHCEHVSYSISWKFDTVKDKEKIPVRVFFLFGMSINVSAYTKPRHCRSLVYPICLHLLYHFKLPLQVVRFGRRQCDSPLKDRKVKFPELYMPCCRM